MPTAIYNKTINWLKYLVKNMVITLYISFKLKYQFKKNDIYNIRSVV